MSDLCGILHNAESGVCDEKYGAALKICDE